MARKKDVPATVSGAGLIAGFWAQLEKERQERGISDEDFHAAVTEESPMIERFADMIAESVKPRLLAPVGTSTIPATTEKFVARDKFVLGTGSDMAVKISFLGDNVKSWFLGKVEGPFPRSTLLVSKLAQSSLDEPIIQELGGEEKAEVTLTEIRQLMERQANGEAGTLLTNGFANIFYVRDISGVLRAVCVSWDGDGWRVGANSTSFPYGWGGGRRVFSRNS